MLAWLLKPSNLAIVALSALLAVTWAAYQTKKVQLAECSAGLEVCQRDVAGYQAEMASANTIIETLKANVALVKKQLGEWKQIALEANEFRKRILATQAGGGSCDAIQAEYAKIGSDITGYFNNSVRRKIERPGAAGDPATTGVLPSADKTGAGRPKDDAAPAR